MRAMHMGVALLLRATEPVYRRTDPARVVEMLAARHPLATAPVLEGLQRLVRAAMEEAGLSALGRAALFWDAAQRLRNLARLDAAEHAAPEIAQVPIERPIFITGLPRSGTTFLHRLLAADPEIFVPRCFETVYPYPEHAPPDRRQVRMNRQLRQFGWLAPGLSGLHPIDGSSPQECSEITAHLFQSLRYETLYHIPSYKAWLAATGHADAYLFHKRFLRHLQHQRGGVRQWVLKSPDHVFALDALLATYPDARLIVLHRDPARVLASVCRLTEVLRAPFAQRVDRLAIGRQNLQDWVRGAAILVREAQAPRLQADRVLHLRFSDVIDRPMEVVRRIHAQFGLALTQAGENAVAALLRRAPGGGYGENTGTLAEYGIAEPELRAGLRQYAQLFGVNQ